MGRESTKKELLKILQLGIEATAADKTKLQNSIKRCARELGITVEEAHASAYAGALATIGYALDRGIPVKRAFNEESEKVLEWARRKKYGPVLQTGDHKKNKSRRRRRKTPER